MRKQYLILASLLSTLALTPACALKPLPDAQLHQSTMTQKDMKAQFSEDPSWWKAYQDPALSRYIDEALAANVELAQSALRLHQALVRAEMAGADLFPVASASATASARRDLKSGDNSRSYQSNVGLSYELDLWGKLRAEKDASKWEQKASAADLDAVRLSLIHSVVNGYFDLRYVLEAQQLSAANLERYRRLQDIVQAKLEAGKVAPVELRQAEQALLSAQGRLTNLAAEEATLRQTLADLLNTRASALPPITTSSLMEQGQVPIDWEIPISALAARPDLQAAEARFASAFRSLEASRASWYPTLTLGAAFGTSASHSAQIFHFPFLSGNAGLSLPFLDWAQVRGKVRLAEDDYELARLDFEKAVTAALNETWAAYRTAEESAKSLALLAERLDKEKAITIHYEARYSLGAAELKDYLSALNTENETRQSVLQAKYALLRDESTVYRAMGGRFLQKK